MRLLRLSCILLVCGCFSQNGSDSQALNNDVEPCRDFRCLHWAMNRGAEPEEPAWRECSWDEVSRLQDALLQTTARFITAT